jgi:hypothetical protein
LQARCRQLIGDVGLCQASMWTPEGQQPALAALLQDTRALPFPKEDLRAINLWMNAGGGGSSIHYDPFHNLLCVVTGRKRVRLWSPALSPCLYPQVRYRVCRFSVFLSGGAHGPDACEVCRHCPGRRPIIARWTSRRLTDKRIPGSRRRRGPHCTPSCSRETHCSSRRAGGIR